VVRLAVTDTNRRSMDEVNQLRRHIELTAKEMITAFSKENLRTHLEKSVNKYESEITKIIINISGDYYDVGEAGVVGKGGEAKNVTFGSDDVIGHYGKRRRPIKPKAN